MLKCKRVITFSVSVTRCKNRCTSDNWYTVVSLPLTSQNLYQRILTYFIIEVLLFKLVRVAEEILQYAMNLSIQSDKQDSWTACKKENNCKKFRNELQSKKKVN